MTAVESIVLVVGMVCLTVVVVVALRASDRGHQPPPPRPLFEQRWEVSGPAALYGLDGIDRAEGTGGKVMTDE